MVKIYDDIEDEELLAGKEPWNKVMQKGGKRARRLLHLLEEKERKIAKSQGKQFHPSDTLIKSRKVVFPQQDKSKKDKTKKDSSKSEKSKSSPKNQRDNRDQNQKGGYQGKPALGFSKNRETTYWIIEGSQVGEEHIKKGQGQLDCENTTVYEFKAKSHDEAVAAIMKYLYSESGGTLRSFPRGLDVEFFNSLKDRKSKILFPWNTNASFTLKIEIPQNTGKVVEFNKQNFGWATSVLAKFLEPFIFNGERHLVVIDTPETRPMMTNLFGGTFRKERSRETTLTHWVNYFGKGGAGLVKGGAGVVAGGAGMLWTGSKVVGTGLGAALKKMVSKSSPVKGKLARKPTNYAEKAQSPKSSGIHSMKTPTGKSSASYGTPKGSSTSYRSAAIRSLDGTIVSVRNAKSSSSSDDSKFKSAGSGSGSGSSSSSGGKSVRKTGKPVKKLTIGGRPASKEAGSFAELQRKRSAGVLPSPTSSKAKGKKPGPPASKAKKKTFKKR